MNNFNKKIEDILNLLSEDRCKSRADKVYGKKTSAYKSGAIVRCRKGKIWKGIKGRMYQKKSSKRVNWKKKK